MTEPATDAAIRTFSAARARATARPATDSEVAFLRRTVADSPEWALGITIARVLTRLDEAEAETALRRPELSAAARARLASESAPKLKIHPADLIEIEFG